MTAKAKGNIVQNQETAEVLAEGVIRQGTTVRVTNAQLDEGVTATRDALKAEETVTVRIPRVEDNSGDLFVCINGYPMYLKRGSTVELPRSIVEVLEHAGEL